MDFVDVPIFLIKLHNKVFISVDVMFVTKMSFIVSVSRNIKFNTVQKLKNKKKSTILVLIDAIIAQYRKLGFHINTIFIDQEFNAPKEDIINRQINLNP